jgi:Ca2+-binding EF-hand superfamily protein
MKNETKRISINNKNLLSETQKMFNSTEISKDFLKQLRLNLDLYSKIDYEIFLGIFEKVKDSIQKILIIIEPKPFFNFFDEDGDGILSEDELLMIFSVIKSKLCHLNQELICEGFYKESTEIKQHIQNLSLLIFNFQTFLRQKLYQKQLNKLDLIRGRKERAKLIKRGKN